MKEIKPLENIDHMVKIPGSKSYSHRMAIAAALSDGVCRIDNFLKSEDTLLTLQALSKMGVKTGFDDTVLTISGTSGRLRGHEEIFLGNSGTSMRLLTGVAALANGTTILTGTERMTERPVGELLDALNQMGIHAVSIHNNGCPPVEIRGKTHPLGGQIKIDCSVSSQFLTALLLIAPCTEKGLVINVTKGPVSRPYIDMTINMMEEFGIEYKRDGYTKFEIPGSQIYAKGRYQVEPDASNAGYFWAAAAITGGRVLVKGIDTASCQGDLGLLECFGKMGCIVKKKENGIEVKGLPLTAIDVDMSDMPDMVPTLSIVSAFARGTTKIRNVAHLKAKECDRLNAVATELSKMGAQVSTSDDMLVITGKNLHGATIETYDDHRIAMSFAICGLKVPGVFIKDETCVAKSFPGFWDVLESLYP